MPGKHITSNLVVTCEGHLPDREHGPVQCGLWADKKREGPGKVEVQPDHFVFIMGVETEGGG